MRSVVFVFLDGVGLAPAHPSNPFSTSSLPALERLAGRQRWTAEARPINRPDHVFHPIDATLGVEGLPQSGTGQGTMLTGINCARLIGRHFGPFPHSKTKDTLARENIFRKIGDLDLAIPDEPAAFINAYPPRFFTMARRKQRWTVTTLCCMETGVRIRTEKDLRSGTALSADLTGESWRSKLNLDVPLLSERDAGRRLAAVSRNHAFTLFEYYLTDKAGHGRIDGSPQDIMRALDHFFRGLLEELNDDQLLLITSDHGNLEDMSRKTHTRHPVPLIARGREAGAFYSSVTSLQGVTPATVAFLAAAHQTGQEP